MISARDRAIEIHMAIVGWKFGREAFLAVAKYDGEVGNDVRRMLTAIEEGIERDRLSVIGSWIGRVALEKRHQ